MNDAFRHQQQQRDRQLQQQRDRQQQQQRDRQQQQLASDARRRQRRREEDDRTRARLLAQRAAQGAPRPDRVRPLVTPPAPAIAAVIERIGGPEEPAGAPRSLRLSVGGVATIGADAGSSWTLRDTGVGAPHAEVRERAGRVEVCDLMSEQGTFVNGVRTQGWTPLRHGDELRLGPVVTRVAIASPTPTPTAAPRRRRLGWPLLLLAVGVGAGVGGIALAVTYGRGDDVTDRPSTDVYACAVLAEPATGPAVVAVQSRLDALGYHLDRDGVFKAVTRKAVADFQRDSGLPVTGAVDAATRRELDAPCA